MIYLCFSRAALPNSIEKNQQLAVIIACHSVATKNKCTAHGGGGAGTRVPPLMGGGGGRGSSAHGGGDRGSSAHGGGGRDKGSS